MGFEIDFLPVGEGSHGGDAIALRFGDLKGVDNGDVFTAVIDGGYKTSGKSLVDHVHDVYETDAVDIVLSTHPDNDHIQGLEHVVRELRVGQLWIQQPSQEAKALVASALDVATGSEHERLATVTASLQQSQSLIELAVELGIEVVSPFAGLAAADGAFRVIGPTASYYDELLPHFRTSVPTGLKAAIAGALEARTGKVPGETLQHETLSDDSRTEPENNASVISLAHVDGYALLFTADAGEDALVRAADYLDCEGFDWDQLDVVQIPHHGAESNVTPAILNRLLGNPVQELGTRRACVSCPRSPARGHPSKRVTNAFHRRGTRVFKTAGSMVRLSRDAPPREGLSKAEQVPFYFDLD
ncbi:MAG TPA: hypothetical protein PKD80_12500 [Microthrixaceae bacterium]|nr:hypothetical protein [Microthrixaceae bacterium]HMT24879.1 hypothetical protein [Microthrixaceae bacterium]HMT62295.1 hypothetical protein [Microthrixaceae bacterium]